MVCEMVMKLTRYNGRISSAYNGVTLLQHFVNSNQSFKSLDLVCKYRLDFQPAPERHRGVVIPSVHNAF